MNEENLEADEIRLWQKTSSSTTPRAVQVGMTTGLWPGVHEHKYETSDHDKMISFQNAHLAVSKWGKLEGETNRNIHQFIGDMR
jgi:hypothetical protein